MIGLKLTGKWNQGISAEGVVYSALTGLCVGIGTNFFLVLFQKGGPLSSVLAILAGGAALMVVIGFILFKEPLSWQRMMGIGFSLVGLWLLKG